MTWWQLILVIWNTALAVSIVIGVYFGTKNKENDGKEKQPSDSIRSVR